MLDFLLNLLARRHIAAKDQLQVLTQLQKKKSHEEPVTNISIVKYQNIRKKSVLTIHCALTLQEAAGPAVDKYLSDDNGLLAAFE